MQEDAGQKKRQVNEHYTDQDEVYTKELFNHKCFNCGTTEYLSVDHNYPLESGYALTRTNAVLLCVSCNSSKGAKLPEEFYSESKFKELTAILEGK